MTNYPPNYFTQLMPGPVRRAREQEQQMSTTTEQRIIELEAANAQLRARAGEYACLVATLERRCAELERDRQLQEALHQRAEQGLRETLEQAERRCAELEQRQASLARDLNWTLQARDQSQAEVEALRELVSESYRVDGRLTPDFERGWNEAVSAIAARFQQGDAGKRLADAVSAYCEQEAQGQ